jgi:hypothetical protein
MATKLNTTNQLVREFARVLSAPQTMEQTALNHAADELHYQRSQKARNDLATDIARRDRLTIKQGHSLKCGILKCHPECTVSK